VSTVARRSLLVGLAAALAARTPAWAQPGSLPARVGLFFTARAWRDSIAQALHARGWIEGRTIEFAWHAAALDGARLKERLSEWPADVLVMGGPHRIQAAMSATATVPIIGLDLESDPVASGFVRTLARPGGNVSGIWLDLPEIAGKQIQFLREVLPRLTGLGVVWDDRIGEPQLAEVDKACRAAGIALRPVSVRAEEQIDGALTRVLVDRPDAVLVLTAPVIAHTLPRIAETLLRSRLPSMSPFSTFPGLGGLMAYGPHFPALWRQLADYVDRVLRGARIGELPVQRPSTFTLILNRRTARALGLTLPPSLVLRADELIQ
jgi:putative ABC transport system substrate-binding protein